MAQRLVCGEPEVAEATEATEATETTELWKHAGSDDGDFRKSAERSVKKSYVWVCLLYGYYSIVFTVMIPALPALMLHLTNDDSSHAAYLYGIANFVRYICEFFASPILGSLADYKGRKPMLVLAFLICAFEFVMLCVFPSIGVVYVSRAVAGIGDCAQATCYTIATDIALFNADTVTNAYGLIAAMMGGGFIVGPLLGGLLVQYMSLQVCFLVAAALSLSGALLTVVLLEESLHYTERKARGEAVTWAAWLREVDPVTPLVRHFSVPAVRQLSIPLMLSSFTAGLGFIWYIYMDDRYHTSATLIGAYLALYGISAVSVQGWAIKRIIPAIWNEKQAAMYGYFLQAAQYTIYGLVPEVWGLFVAVVVFSPGLVADPALKALIVKASVVHGDGVDIQGNLQGTLSGIRTLCTAFGALAFPALYSYCVDADRRLMWVPFVAGGLMFFLAFCVIGCSYIPGELLTKRSKLGSESVEDALLGQAATEDNAGLLVLH